MRTVEWVDGSKIAIGDVMYANGGDIKQFFVVVGFTSDERLLTCGISTSGTTFECSWIWGYTGKCNDALEKEFYETLDKYHMVVDFNLKKIRLKHKKHD